MHCTTSQNIPVKAPTRVALLVHRRPFCGQGGIGWAVVLASIVERASIVLLRLAERTSRQPAIDCPCSALTSHAHIRRYPLLLYAVAPNKVPVSGGHPVVFKQDAKELGIRKLLTTLHDTIVDGPSDFGQYRLRIKAGTEPAALKELRSSGLVDL